MKKIEKLHSFEATKTTINGQTLIPYISELGGEQIQSKINELIEWQNEAVEILQENAEQYSYWSGNIEARISQLENKAQYVTTFEKRLPMPEGLFLHNGTQEVSKWNQAEEKQEECEHPVQSRTDRYTDGTFYCLECSKRILEKPPQSIIGNSMEIIDNSIVNEEQWQPKEEEPFWFIKVTGDIAQATYFERDSYWTKATKEFGNCFKTKQEAEAMRDKIQALLKGEE